MGHFTKFICSREFSNVNQIQWEKRSNKYTQEHILWSPLKKRRGSILDLVKKSVKDSMAHIPCLCSLCVANVHWVFQLLFIIQNTFPKPLVCISSPQTGNMLPVWLHACNLGKTHGQCRNFSWHVQVAQSKAHRENRHGLSQAVIQWIRWLRPACWERKMKQDSLEGAWHQPARPWALRPQATALEWRVTSHSFAVNLTVKKIKKWLSWTLHSHSSAGLFSKSIR